MEILSLIYRPTPKEGESLSSYMHRVAKSNFISNHELWRSITPEGVHYPQSSMSSGIDVCPINLIDIKKFENMLLNSFQPLELLTFIPVLEKMGINKSSMSRSRSLSGLISENRRFCPECLKADSYYKLIWQVKEVNFCFEHNVMLQNKCPNCGKNMPILPSDSLIGKCSYCNYELSESNSEEYVPTDTDPRIMDDWLYLLNASAPCMNVIEHFSNQQNLALRVLHACTDIKLSKRELIALKGIYQIARESKSNQSSLHLKNTLYFSRLSKVSLEKLLTTKIPDDFIDNILIKPMMLKNYYHCIAPWCKNYLRSGRLERTATSTKHLSSGQTLNYYLYCPCCGTEYAINENKELGERGYFIDLAWNKVKNSLNNDMSLSQLAELFDSTEDKIKRCIIFLSANSLISKNNLQIKLPKVHDNSLKEKIIELVNNGILGKKIKSSLGLSYNSFLYYWFLPEIQIAYINRHISRPDKRKCENTLSNELDAAINHLVKNNINISVKSVCKVLNISSETLRNWNLLDVIQKAKNKLIATNMKKIKEMYLIESEHYIKRQNLSGNHVYSDQLYLHLGKKRTVIVRTMPEVTRKISNLLKNQSV